MWSVGVNGRHSIFNPARRLLFPVRDATDGTKRLLVRTLQLGTCTGIVVTTPDDHAILHLILTSLQSMEAKNPLLRRQNIAMVVTTGSEWTNETLHERVSHVLGQLHMEQLDVLLLSRRMLGLAARDADAFGLKAAVLECWDHLTRIQALGLVREIGVSDLSIREMEFIFTAFPQQAPTALCVQVELATTSAAHYVAIPFKRMLAYSHGHQMDLLVHFPFRALDELPPSGLREQWKHLVSSIATRHREQGFDVPVVHEADTEPFRLEKRGTTHTEALQTSMQICVRYLLQLGVIVIPLPEGEDSDQLSEEESKAIFEILAHPFTTLPPSHSPQLLYSSVLSPDELRVIEQVLPLIVMPTP